MRGTLTCLFLTAPATFIHFFFLSFLPLLYQGGVTFYALFALEAHVIYITLFALVGSGTDLTAPIVTEGAISVGLPHEDTIFGEVVQVVHCLAFLFVVDTTVPYGYDSCQVKTTYFYVMCAT